MKKEDILEDYSIALISRECSLMGRKEVLTGKAKFGIFGDGKEVPQVAMARAFREGDFRSGYYRDQTFMMAIGVHTVEHFFAGLYAHADIEADPTSAGRQMGGHFTTHSLDENGEWKNSGTASETQDPMSLDMVLTRIGLKTIQFRNIDYIATDRETGTARAGVRVYQADIGVEFIFEVKLVQGGDGVWRVTEIQNLHDFVAMIAKAHDAILADYLAKSQAIIDAHGKSVQEIEQEFSSTLQKGSLGNDETRQALKTIMLEKAAADWTQRKAELSDLTVPPMADTLHHLRLRSCDMRIAYILGYAAWLDDKKAATIREAQAKLKQAKTLENEAAALARHMSGQSNAVPQPQQKPTGNETSESMTELQ